jgi:hypothetical protein
MRRFTPLLSVGTLLAAAVALPLVASAASPARSAQALHVTRGTGVVTDSAQPQALLVLEYPSYRPSSTPTATIISLTGKRLPVPARVRTSPFGLSPDARMVAAVSGTEPGATRQEYATAGVLVGAVRGGSMRSILRGDCDSPPCPYGADPSYAWSPDSQRLAAAANTVHGPTLLKVFDRNGRLVRSFALPRTNPSLEKARVYHHLVSWSPDGSRLLLRQDTQYASAVVVVDITSGRVRTLERLFGPGGLTDPVWSPDGRYVALAFGGTQDSNDVFAVIDAASAQPVIHRSVDKGSGPHDLVWAPDSRSLFLSVYPGGIDRLYLPGGRTNHVMSSGVPLLALSTGLVYSTRALDKPDVLHLYDFATGHREQLMSSRTGFQALLPLSRIP